MGCAAASRVVYLYSVSTARRGFVPHMSTVAQSLRRGRGANEGTVQWANRTRWNNARRLVDEGQCRLVRTSDRVKKKYVTSLIHSDEVLLTRR